MMAHENGVIRRLVTGNKSTFSKTFVQYAEQYKTQQKMQQQHQTTVAKAETVPMQTLTRTCILGCKVNKLALCRFPVHDPKRCNNWLKFFDVDAACVERLGGLANLRVCLKHFNQKQQMAKTRIKTTPTRLQKDALAATATATAALTLTTAATPTPKVSAKVVAKIITPTSKEKVAAAAAATTAAVPANVSQDLKRQHLNGQQQPQQLLRSHLNTNGSLAHAQESLKRTTSMSSATSTHSHSSDTHSNASDTECAPATTANGGVRTVIGHTADQSQAPTDVANVGLLGKLNGTMQGRRKVYMITEKSSDESSAHAQTSAQRQAKRKMYLIMEEQNGDAQAAAATSAALPHSRLHATKVDNKRKKLTLYTDQTGAVQLTQKFEQILPEILSRIQATQNGASQVLVTAQQQQQQQNQHHQQQLAENDVPWEKLPAANVLHTDEKPKQPITLPPKKNRTKITQADDDIHSEVQSTTTTTTATAAVTTETTATSMAAITVKTSASILNQNLDESNGHSNNSSNSNSSNNKNNKSADTTGAVLTPINRKSNGQSGPLSHAHGSLNSEKQINLSSDFLFLMKMLPKLESIPEPQKQQVKSCIESFINQSASRCESPY